MGVGSLGVGSWGVGSLGVGSQERTIDYFEHEAWECTKPNDVTESRYGLRYRYRMTITSWELGVGRELLTVSRDQGSGARDS